MTIKKFINRINIITKYKNKKTSKRSSIIIISHFVFPLEFFDMKKPLMNARWFEKIKIQSSAIDRKYMPQ